MSSMEFPTLLSRRSDEHLKWSFNFFLAYELRLLCLALMLHKKDQVCECVFVCERDRREKGWKERRDVESGER